MRKLRILHFMLSSAVGGIETFLFSMVRKVDRERIQFDFVTDTESPALEKELCELGCNIYRVAPRKQVWRYWKDIKKLVDMEYDIVHLHKNSAMDILPMIVAKRGKNRPAIIVHAHATGPLPNRYMYMLHCINQKKINAYADLRLACSVAAAEWLYGGNAEQSIIIPNGIFVEDYRYSEAKYQQIRQQLDIDRNTLVIGHVGRFDADKNQRYLIQLLYDMKQKESQVMLLLIGDGYEKENVQALANSLGINSQVRFLGVRRDIASLLSAMDVFVFPSRNEGLPIALVEAQAAGLDIYASDSITREVSLTDGITWFSVSDSPDLLAERIFARREKHISEIIRIQRNQQVASSDFHIEKACEILIQKYLDIQSKLPRYGGNTAKGEKNG